MASIVYLEDIFAAQLPIQIETGQIESKDHD